MLIDLLRTSGLRMNVIDMDGMVCMCARVWVWCGVVWCQACCYKYYLKWELVFTHKSFIHVACTNPSLMEARVRL